MARQYLRCLLTLGGTVALFALSTLAFDARTPQRGPIQTPGGGRGPGAAPEANDPANAGADLSAKPPILPLSPEEEAKRLWLPAGYRMEPVLAATRGETRAKLGWGLTVDGCQLVP